MRMRLLVVACWHFAALIGCGPGARPAAQVAAVPAPAIAVDTPAAADAPPPATEAAAGPPCSYGDEAGCAERCDAGDEESCGLLAAMYANGVGVDRVPYKARELAERACRVRDARACNVLAYLLERGIGGPEDGTRALKLYQQACSDGEPRACLNLGRAYHLGVSSAPKDRARALGLFVQACHADLAEGCTAAGTLASGVGGTGDQRAELRYYELGCRGGDATGCDGLMRGYARVAGVAPEQATLVPELERRCGASDADSCKALGDLHQLGPFPLLLSPFEAEKRYQRACDLGSLPGCGRLGAMLVVGSSEAAERERGQQLLRKGCDGGDRWCCRQLDAASGP